MSISSEISRLQTAKAGLKTAIEAKGVTVPSEDTLDDYPALVASISGGGGGFGSVIIEDTLDAAGGTIRSITTTDEVHLQSKTVTPTTSQQTITPDSGYDALSQVVVNASTDIPKANFIDFMEGDSVSFDFSGVTKIRSYALAYATTPSAYFPDATTIGTYIANTSNIPVIVLPAITSLSASGVRTSGSNLTTLDIGGSCTYVAQNSCQNSSALTTIILRSASKATLQNINAFGGTPFASGGTGGTIYIPKSLYDHLGDGTASDYKAATNWSTVDGYGTITWAKIEGSQYEHYYADGTPIPTT